MIKRWQFQALMIGIFVVCMAMVLVLGVPARAETGCKAKCQKQQNKPSRPQKSRYAVKQVQTIHIPTELPESHRRAIMRMQPQYQRWAFTGFAAIAIYNFRYEG
jgi:hypothetical protein